MTADFQFYLNTQGLRGRTGAKGDDGFSPIITIGKNTLNTFTLMITTQDGTFETPNLRGSIINNAGAGTYLRYDAETDSIYLSELQTASETQLGGVTIATEDELANAAGTGVITADNMGAGIYGALKAGNNVALTLDEETGLVTISAEGGTQGTLNYEELENKPKLYGKEIVGDKKLSDFIELKSPLKETIAVDYEKDVVIVNGNKTDDSLTLNTSWAPLFTTSTSDTSSPFDMTGDITLNGNEFTPSSGVEMPYKVGDIIGVPGGTGADIALGNIREDGQFIFTHLLRIDGLGVSYINRAFMPILTKTNSNGTLKCTCDSTVTNELTTGQNFTDNCAYFQVRIEDGKMVAVFLKSVDGVFKNGVKVTSSNKTTIKNTEKLQRFSFGGVGSNVNLLSQFKLYRQPNLKLEECTNQSAFAGLTNMVNWKFPSDENSLNVLYDNHKIVLGEHGELTTSDLIMEKSQLQTMVKSGKNVVINAGEDGSITINAISDEDKYEEKFSAIAPLSKELITNSYFVNGIANGGKVTLSGCVYVSGGKTPNIYTGSSVYSGSWMKVNRGMIYIPIDTSGGYWYGTLNTLSDKINGNYYIALIDKNDDGFIRLVTTITAPYGSSCRVSSMKSDVSISYNQDSGYFYMAASNYFNTAIETQSSYNENTQAVYIDKTNKKCIAICGEYRADVSDAIPDYAWNEFKYVMVQPYNKNVWGNITDNIDFTATDIFKNSKPYTASNAEVADNTGNLIDISTTSTQRNLYLKYDNQTLQVNAEGQLVVNMDEIGGDVSALSARVTTLEGTVGTLETSVTDLEDSTGQLQTRVTNLENNIDGGVI